MDRIRIVEVNKINLIDGRGLNAREYSALPSSFRDKPHSLEHKMHSRFASQSQHLLGTCTARQAATTITATPSIRQLAGLIARPALSIFQSSKEYLHDDSLSVR
jgi:hypothetical protein